MSSLVRVEEKGLAPFRAAIERASGQGQERLDAVLVAAAESVVTRARRGVPTLSGKARASIKATGLAVRGGGSRAPYYPWLDYGGRVGRKKSIARSWRSGGRYIYPALTAEWMGLMTDAERELVDLARDAGLEVT